MKYRITHILTMIGNPYDPDNEEDFWPIRYFTDRQKQKWFKV